MGRVQKSFLQETPKCITPANVEIATTSAPAVLSWTGEANLNSSTLVSTSRLLMGPILPRLEITKVNHGAYSTVVDRAEYIDTGAWKGKH